MEQSLSWEANTSSASQEIPRILWNPKVHYRIHKSPPPVPILSSSNSTILKLEKISRMSVYKALVHISDAYSIGTKKLHQNYKLQCAWLNISKKKVKTHENRHRHQSQPM
jgi:hypothetical protein